MMVDIVASLLENLLVTKLNGLGYLAVLIAIEKKINESWRLRFYEQKNRLSLDFKTDFLTKAIILRIYKKFWNYLEYMAIKYVDY